MKYESMRMRQRSLPELTVHEPTLFYDRVPACWRISWDAR